MENGNNILKYKIMFRSLFDDAGDLIFIHDLAGKLIEVNQIAAKRLGYTRGKLLQMKISDLESGTCNLHKMAEELERNDQFVCRTTLLGKGEEFPVEMNSSVIEIGGKKALMSIARDISKRMKLEEELKKSRENLEENYRELVNSIDGIVWEANAETFHFTFVSKKAEHMLGYPVELWLEEPEFWESHLHPEDEWAVNYRKRATMEKKNYRLEYRMVAADGNTVWFKDIVNVVVDDDQVKLRGIMVDITDRKKAELEYMNIDRALRTLSICNQAVMLARDESELLNEICRIITELGGYRLAWIGFAENDEKKSVKPVAYSGYEEGYLNKLNLTWDDTEFGRGPTGKAIRTSKPVVAKNILEYPEFKPWRNEAIIRGYFSSIALPLISDGIVFGSLNIYSDEEDAFSPGEVKLLKKIARNLSFGIETLRERAIRGHIEEDKAQQQKRLEALWRIAKLVDADHKTLCDRVMAIVTDMTQSKYAFYGFLDESESTMSVYSWSKDVMKDCQIENRPIVFPVVDSGLWGDAVREKKTVIINNYMAHPDRKGIPKGHVPITRIMVVPVFRQKRIVALTGVANKPSEYIEEDARQVNVFTAAVQTILERRKAEENLKMSEEKYRATFENTGTAMLIIEEDNKISLVNSELEKLLGHKKEEILGRNWTEFVHSDDLEDMFNPQLRTDRKIPKNYEFRMIDKRNNIKYIFSTFENIPHSGKTVASLIDVTHLRRLNNLLKALSEINEIVAKEDSPDVVMKSVCDKLTLVYDAVFTCLLKNNVLFTMESRGIDIDDVDGAIANCPFISKAIEGEVIKIQAGKLCEGCLISHHEFILALPLVQEERNYGIITIHSNSDFSTDEEELLRKLSSNIAFALSSYEAEESRKEAVKQLVVNLMQFDHSADRLRNPLAVIMGSLELRYEIGTEELLRIIKEQAKRIKDELDELRKEEVKTHRLIEKN